jgi:hypothetical protein
MVQRHGPAVLERLVVDDPTRFADICSRLIRSANPRPPPESACASWMRPLCSSGIGQRPLSLA